ncbi:MAG TPA: nitroreductase family protein [archaeon]|nr:nitroreductase family protein [archaeon]
MDTKINVEFFDFIKERKSIRNFIYQKIDDKIIKDILECGRWAPSGRNSQPWHICVVIHPTVKHMLAENSKYKETIESAYVNLVIFLDLERGYDRVKDLQAIGAFIENILLAVHAHKELGAVWIGEILNNKESVNKIFKLPNDKFELMACLAIGVIDETQRDKSVKPRDRQSLESFTTWY